MWLKRLQETDNKLVARRSFGKNISWFCWLLSNISFREKLESQLNVLSCQTILEVYKSNFPKETSNLEGGILLDK